MTETLRGSLYVRRVVVDQLFGRYSYDLRLLPSVAQGPSSLIILYGDNGSGKTTILKLIFNLLAHGHKGGHRRFLSKIPFKLFRVELGSEIAITVDRTGGSLVGPFSISLNQGTKQITRADWILEEQGRVRTTPQTRQAGSEILSYLADLNIGLYFLSDDRKIRSNQYGHKDEAETDEVIEDDLVEYRHVLRRRLGGVRTGTLHEEDATTPLRTALERASSWATQQVLRGSSKGEQDANAIYTDIIQRIATAQKKDVEKEELAKGQIIEELEKQAKRSVDFSRYGLIAPIHIENLTESIRVAPSSVFPTIVEVLRPYVNGLEARLNALQPIHDNIDTFCGIVNSFYRDKKLTFNLPHGPTVETSDGDPLSPGALSSGERQLLLLFCNILVAKDQNSVFIIDEPEISLNVKWQRKLVRTLLDFTKGSYVQFLLASHSIELLAGHSDHVVKLIDSDDR